MTNATTRSLILAPAFLWLLFASLVATGCADVPQGRDQYDMSAGLGSGIEGFPAADDDDSAGDDDDSGGDDDDSGGDDDDSGGDDDDSANEGGANPLSVDADGDGVVDALDCAENDPNVFPGNFEICDGLDQDCDGIRDNGFDSDADGVTTCGPDGMIGSADDDCNDIDNSSYPGASEWCDGFDNDCDGMADEDFLGPEFDNDGDGVPLCTDCDDMDADNFPGNEELCDGLDNDCDPRTDEDLACAGEKDDAGRDDSASE